MSDDKIELNDILTAIEKANEQEIQLFVSDLFKVVNILQKDELSGILETLGARKNEQT